MKSAAVAAAAVALVGGVEAHNGHAHAHQEFAKRDLAEMCSAGCTTYYSTMTGSAWLYTPSVEPSFDKPVDHTDAPVATSTWYPTSPTSTYEPAATATWYHDGPATVPTPIATVCPTTGVHKFPASTITLSDPTTVCGAWTTALPSAGVWTLGGVTTIVDHSTVFVCPYATTEVNDGTVTSVVRETTYTCPSAGTWTIAPITTSVSAARTVVVPEVTSYAAGTWTAPEAEITVTDVEYVYYCPYTSAAWSTSGALVTGWANATSVPSAAASSTGSWTRPSTTASPGKTNSTVALGKTNYTTSSTGLGGSNNKWGITLSPYDDNGGCKSAETIMSQMSQISAKGIKTVRVYSTDCDTLPNFGAAARAYGMTLIVGVYVSEAGCDNSTPDVADQIAALAGWADHDLAELVVVANEAMFNNWCTVEELSFLLTEVRTKLRAVGYTAPITTTDTVGAWTSTAGVSTLCSLIDVIACNAYAFFNADTVPSNAGSFVSSQLALVQDVCPGLDGWVLESGWPSEGTECNGEACASPANQATAIGNILNAVGDKVVLLSAFDEEWKSPGEYGVEQHWGCLDSIPV